MADEPRQDDARSEDRLGGWMPTFRRTWWKIALLSLAAGLATLLAMFALPNIYRSTAVITPVSEEGKQTPLLGGALASFGIVFGGPTKVEDLETLFRSEDLTVRVFRKYDLWPSVLGDRYDPRSRTIVPGWIERLTGETKGAKPPGDWDAIRAARDNLKVAMNKRSGTLVISFDSRSAEGSAAIVRYYLEEGKSRLQEEAFARASRNKQFISEQIGKTIDALTRDRLYTLYGQEVEKEMLARNREQFGFKTVDNARAPDRKFKPHRAQGAIAATLVAFFAFSGIFLWRELRKGRPDAGRTGAAAGNGA